jgi:hypothetical protein
MNRADQRHRRHGGYDQCGLRRLRRLSRSVERLRRCRGGVYDRKVSKDNQPYNNVTPLTKGISAACKTHTCPDHLLTMCTESCGMVRH